MTSYTLIFPMFAMVLLSLIVLIMLFTNRVSSVRRGEINAYYYKTYQGASEPENLMKLSQHVSNLFETPVLFYAACLCAMIINIDTLLVQILAWLYVLSRVAHAYIHIGRNKLRKRIAAYMTSWVILLSLWLDVVIETGFKL